MFYWRCDTASPAEDGAQIRITQGGTLLTLPSVREPIQEHTSEIGVITLPRKVPCECVSEWACVKRSEGGKWMKMRGSKSLSKSLAVYLYILLKILSFSLSRWIQSQNGAPLQFCSLDCSMLFLWTTTIGNHHDQRPLTAAAHRVVCRGSCGAWWKVVPCSWRETPQQADGEIRYLNDASGLLYSGQEIWGPGFLPHWLRGTFPRSVAISLPASSSSTSSCDSPSQLFFTPMWSIAPCRAEMHHTASLSAQEIWAYVLLYVWGRSAAERYDTLCLPTPNNGSSLQIRS